MLTPMPSRSARPDRSSTDAAAGTEQRDSPGPRTLDTVTWPAAAPCRTSGARPRHGPSRVVTAGSAIWPGRRGSAPGAASPAPWPPAPTLRSHRAVPPRRRGRFASDTSIPEIWFPSVSPSPSGRVDTGPWPRAGGPAAPPAPQEPAQPFPRHTRRTTSFHRALEDATPPSSRRRAAPIALAKRLAVRHRPVERGPRRAEEAGGECSPRRRARGCACRDRPPRRRRPGASTRVSPG